MSPLFKKVFLIGFSIGFFGFFIMTLGLIIRPIEIVGNIFLAPTKFVLSPLRDSFANVQGFVNILTFAVVTGVIYGIFGIVISSIMKKMRVNKSTNKS